MLGKFSWFFCGLLIFCKLNSFRTIMWMSNSLEPYLLGLRSVKIMHIFLSNNYKHDSYNSIKEKLPIQTNTFLSTRVMFSWLLNQFAALFLEDLMLSASKFYSHYSPTVKPVLSGHLKKDKTKVLVENCSLMKVESIAECSPLTCIKR